MEVTPYKLWLKTSWLCICSDQLQISFHHGPMSLFTVFLIPVCVHAMRITPSGHWAAVVAIHSVTQEVCGWTHSATLGQKETQDARLHFLDSCRITELSQQQTNNCNSILPTCLPVSSGMTWAKWTIKEYNTQKCRSRSYQTSILQTDQHLHIIDHTMSPLETSQQGNWTSPDHAQPFNHLFHFLPDVQMKKVSCLIHLLWLPHPFILLRFQLISASFPCEIIPFSF